MDSKIKEALINIVGPDNFTDALIDRVSFSYDSSGLNRRPAAAVWIKKHQPGGRCSQIGQ